MAVLCAVQVAVLALAMSVQPLSADIISDITTSETDEFDALQIKVEMFWKPILSAAEDVQMEKHLVLYAHAEDVIKSLPAENKFARETLREALDHLKKADDASFKLALSSSQVATEKLDAPHDGSSSGFSFLTGGQNFLQAALKRFIGGGQYSKKLLEHVQERQSDILPVLRGAAGATGNVLSDCRLASSKGFEVQKYDIYNDHVPKTPKIAKDLADRIIDAAGATRHRFMTSITDVVQGITKDEQEKHEDAAVTVTKASLRGLHRSVASAEAKISLKTSHVQFANLVGSSNLIDSWL